MLVDFHKFKVCLKIEKGRKKNPDSTIKTFGSLVRHQSGEQPTTLGANTFATYGGEGSE